MHPVNLRLGGSRRNWLKNTLTAGAGLAAFSLPGISDAQTEPASIPPPPPMSTGASQTPQPNAVTAGTSYITFSGLDFRPANSSHTFDWADGGYCGIYPLNAASLYTAKIFLPERAKITECEFYILHKTPGSVICYLMITTPSIGYAQSPSSAVLSIVSNSVQTVPLSVSNLPFVVDNTTSGFYFGWIPANTGADEILYGARIGYIGGIGRFKAN